MSLLGCGSGVPLLHSAHTLPAGRTAFAVGVSDRFVLGNQQRALDDARRYSRGVPPEGPQGAPSEGLQYARGVLVAVAEGPAVAPFVAARAGIAGKNEAGLSYSGQSLRGDFRHAFDWGHSALSVGLGVTGRGFGQSALDLPGTDLTRARGLGVDLPILLGYRSDADLLSVWAGLRGSLDRWTGTLALDSRAAFDLSATRVALGPVIGMSIGLPPFWVSAELELDYAHVTGSLDRPGTRYDARIDGWSARPAGALVAKF